MSFPKIEGYVVTEKLGSGSYSTVYKAYNKVGGRQTVAIKCVDKSRVKHSGSAVDNLITEIRLMKSLSHPHIVRMHSFTWDDKNIYIIMEYCCGGDLSKYIHRNGRVPEKQVRYFLQQLASALKFLYEQGVVHMDLKPHNLLLHKVSGKYILKVGDFGFAQHLSAEWSRSVRGSPLYMAPEMIAGECGPSVDLWSVGVIMYECLFGRAPYSSSTFKELVDKIQKQAPIEIPSNSCISCECRALLRALLVHDPARRITYQQFFEHPYLDLEHMPSAENYEKAVSLIKQAIELDAAGRLEPAFEAYKESLLYLVPCVGCESDAVRRAALTDKLTRYMERAEEIKLYLKGGTPTEQNNQNSRKRQETYTNGQNAPAPCASKLSEEVVGTVGTVQGTEPATHPCAEPEASQQPACSDKTRVTPRFALKRLFGRHASLPFLDVKDSSIVTSGTSHADKPQKETENNDTCRIT